MRRVASHQRGASFAMAIVLAGCAAAPSSSVMVSEAPTPTAAETATSAATSAPPTPPAATTPPAPSVTPTASDVGWHAVPAQDSVRGGQLLDVAWTGSRFIAVSDGGILDSDDGLAWHRQPVSPDTRVELLAAGPEGIVVFGSAGGAITTWVSADGLAWTQGSEPFPLPDLGQDSIAVHDVVAMATGWLAVGTREGQCSIECGTDPIRAHVWTSPDGLTWTRVPRQAALEGGGMSSVARVAVGGFVAAGVTERQPAVWTSPDGLAWTGVEDTEVFRESGIARSGRASAATGVAASGDTVVVVAQAYEQDLCPEQYDTASCGGVRAWWSVDGVSWKPATVDRARDGQVFGVTATPDGFLAYGPSGEPSCAGGIWSSTTGRTWTCETSEDEAYALFSPYAGAASETMAVVVGLTSDGWDENGDEGLPGSVWVRARP